MKLLPTRVQVNDLVLHQEPTGCIHITHLKQVKCSISIDFISSGDLSRFLKKDGSLKSKKLINHIAQSTMDIREINL